MKKRDSNRTHSLHTKVLTWVMTLVMLLSLIPFGAIPAAEAAEKEMWEIALENDYLSYDTVNACGGTGHLQGICVDDKMEYMYFSYTDLLAKVDMKTGEVVGSIGGFGEGGFGTAGGAHLGCLSYYDGMIYGSLEYKTPGKKFFVCAFDEDVITTTGMDIKDLSSGVYGILLREPTEDFRDPLNDTPEADGFAANGGVLGHAFGCSGIDGITFGTLPGDTSGKMYMLVAYGVYGEGDTAGWDNRYDNNYNVIQCYDPAEFELGDSCVRRFTYARGVDNAVDVAGGEYLEAAETLYVWTGNTNYGVQNMEYDKATGDILLYTYGATKGWNSGALFVVDGSVAPVEKTLEVGQSNTAADAAVQAAAKEKAKSYMVDTDGDGTADAYPTGMHAALKCVCGKTDHAAAACGDTGVTAKICGTSSPATSVYGAVSLDENYFYLATGNYSAALYKRTENHSYSKVAGTVDKQKLVHLSMDAADLYEKDGVVYMKNSADPTGAHDAIVEGTTSGAGVQGGAGSALSFDAWKYPNRVDQVYLSQDTIAMINEKVENAKGYGTFSYSFWYKTPTATDGNFLPVAGFFREDNTYANIIQHRWRKDLGSVTNGIGSATVGSTATAVPNPNKVDPGDANFYIYKGVDNAWHHIAVTEAAGVINVYVDGVLYKSRSVTANHLQAEPFAEFIIGGGKGKVWQDMNNRGRVIGEVDDVQIWSGALTADEVAAMYAAKPANAATNPAHPGVVEATPNKTYAAYDLTDDAGKDLTVDAGMAVTSITGLTKDTDYTVSGNSVTLKASWLAAQSCGIVTLQLNGTTALDVTVTDREVPVLHFDLNKSSVSGNVVTDSSVYGKNATATDSVTFTDDQAGVINGAMLFDGYNYQYPTYVKLDETNADWLNSVLKNGYTLNFWANANAENGTRMAFGGLFAENARPLGAIETNDGDNSNANIDGKLKVQVNVGKTAANSAQEIKPSATVSTTKAWTMYTATYDKATNTVKLYVNKAEVAAGTVEDNIIGAIDQLFIGHQYGKYYSTAAGSRDWTTRGGFRGAISDFSVYNYALDATAITALYDEGLEVSFDEVVPVINWTMDADSLNGDGTIVEASSELTSYYQNVIPVAGVDGKAGGAMYFTGNADSGDYSRVWLSDAGITELNNKIGSSMAVSFWMQPDFKSTSEGYPFTGQWSPVGGVFGESDHRFLMVAEFRGNNLNYCAQSGGDKRLAAGGSKMTHGNWYYVVMTFDSATTETIGSAASNVRRIYIADVNGNIIAEPTPDRGFTSTTLFNKITHVEFGGQYAKGHWTDTNVRGRYVGAIDDIRIYNVPMTRDDVITMAKAKTATGSGVTLESYEYEVGLAECEDITVTTANAGELTAISGLSAAQYQVSGSTVTIDGDALAALGVGEHQLTLTFANGEKTIAVTVVDDRAWFTGGTLSFDKTAPADVTVTAADSFGAVTAVSADDLREADYTVSGKTVTVKKEWLMQQQPGQVALSVTTANGTQTALIYVTNAAPTATLPAGEAPYPVLYYEMDMADLTTSTAANGNVTGTLLDKSGSGMTLQVGGLTKGTADSAGAANGSIFFDGYRDFDISRAWLDEQGVAYLNSVLGDEITISFWHQSDRISSNYMPVLGLFAADDRPLLLAEFRDSGSERASKGETTKPTLTATASGSKSIDSGVVSAAEVTMNSTWHHYVMTYNNTTGAVTVYVDGAAGATGTVSAGQLNNIAKFEIGGLANAEYFNISNYYSTKNHGRLYGYLDEVKVYNTALDATQVATLYSAGVDETLPYDLTGITLGITDANGDAVVKDENNSILKVNVQAPTAPVEGAAVSVANSTVTVTLPTGGESTDYTKVTLTDGSDRVVTGIPVVVADADADRRYGKTSDGEGAVVYLAQFVPGDWSVTGNAAATYNKSAQASATVENAVGAAITYTWDGGSDTTVPSFTDAGTYAVTYTVEKPYYESQAGSYSFTIHNAPASQLNAAATGISAKYDGTAKAVSVTAIDGATIEYSTDGGSTWSTTAPTFTDMVETTVAWRVSKTNYDTATGTVDVKITEGEITGYKVEANDTVKYDGTAKVSGTVTEGVPDDATITYTWDGGSGTAVPSFTVPGSYKVDYTISADQYSDVTGSYTFTIEKGDITGYKVEANAAAKYDGSAKVSGTVTEGVPTGATITFAWDGGSGATVPSFTEVGTYEVIYTVSKQYYNDVTGSYTFTIEKGDITGYKVEANDTVEYDGQPKSSATVTEGTPAGASITYTWDEGNESGNTVPKFTAVGSYEVSYIISKPGYNNVTGSYTFVIEKGTISQHGITVNPTVKYDGTAKASATEDAAVLGDATVTYKWMENGQEQTSAAVPSFTKVGSYTVSYTVSKTGYEDATGSYTFVIEKGDMTGYKVEANDTVKYDGTAKTSGTVAEGTPAGAAIAYEWTEGGQLQKSDAVPAFTKVGSYTVSYTVSLDGYNDVTGSYTFAIEKGDLLGYKVEANDTAKYDGTAKASGTVTEGTPAGATITYTCGNDIYDKVPEFTAVGTYEVRYTVSKDGYNDVTGSYTFIIEKGDIVGYSVTANAAAKYDGNPKASATVDPGKPADAAITYTCGNNTYDKVPEFTDAGTYEVSYTISKEGYSDVTGAYSFTINKADITGYSITANAAAKYNGETKTSATVVAGLPVDATITYKWTENEQEQTSTTVPGFILPGTYEVSYTVSKANYNDVTGSYRFTIEKGELTGYSVTANAAAKYNGESKTSAAVTAGIPADAVITYKWMEGNQEQTANTVPAFIAVGTYDVSYTISRQHYNDVTGTYAFTINKGDLTGYSVTANAAAKYDGNPKVSAAVTVGVPADAAITYKWMEGNQEQTSTTVPAFTEVGIYDVSYTISRDSYNDVTGSYRFEVKKGDLTNYGVEANDTVKYDGSAKVSATVTAGVPADATITFVWTEGQDEKSSTTVPSFTLPGVYTVDYTISRDSYNDVTDTYQFTIEKGDITGYAVKGNDTVKYDGSEKFSATVTTGVPADAAITYTCGSDTYDEVPEFTAVGTYEVSYTVSKEHYNDVTGSYSFTIEKGDLTGYEVKANDTVKYNGEAHQSAAYTEGTPAGATVTYKWMEGEQEQTSNTAPSFTKVGTYTVSYTISKDGYNSVTGSYQFTIEKGDLTGYSVEANDAVKHNGEAHVSATVTEGTPAGATITYKWMEGEQEQTSTTVPSFIMDGTYAVSYTVSKDGYNDVLGGYTFVIEKGDIVDYVIEANDTVVYDGEAHVSATVTAGIPDDADILFAWTGGNGVEQSNTVPSFTDAGVYEVAYFISKDGYNRVGGRYVFTIERAPLETGIELLEKAEHTGQPIAAAKLGDLPEGLQFRFIPVGADGQPDMDNMYELNAVPSFTEIGQYKLLFAAYLDDNHKEVMELFTFQIVEPAPETGDTANLGLWIGLLVGSVVLLIALFLVLRRKKDKK